MSARLSWLLAFLGGGLAAHLLGPAPALVAAGPPDFTEVIARADPGVVHVTTQLPGDRAPGSRDDAVGAGFVFDPAGFVVTSRHVLRGASRILVSVRGRGTYEATVVGQDEFTDVALLRIAATGLPTLSARDPRTLRLGEWVLAAGSPFHLDHSWSVGIVSGLGRSQVGVNLRGYEDFIQTDASANLGSSGGPLVDASGRVVGMISAILSRTGRSQGVTLAVPVDVVLDTARRLRDEGRVDRGSLGVVVREGDTRGTGEPGLEITRFEARSPAESAGLRVGDRIVAIQGRPLARVSDLQRVVWAHPPGTVLLVEFVRDGRRLRASVRLR